MYVYKRTEPELWTVGFYDHTGKYQTDSDHDDREEAAKRVSFLNGININFAMVAVIMERFRRYSPQSFVDECFKNHPDHHRQHLLTKFPANGNILEMLWKLDEPHMHEVNKFLNDLLPPQERLPYLRFV